MWWLWNQLFQYAFVKALSQRHKLNFMLDISQFEKNYKIRTFELENFNIEQKYATKKEIPFYEKMEDWVVKWLFTRLNPHHYYENNSIINPLLFNQKLLNIKNWYISWAFMSELYFKDEWKCIKSDFIFTKQTSDKTKEIEHIIKNQNSVSVHIRRWDYLKYPDIYPRLWIEYYNKAFNLIWNKVEKPFFVFFSDDIEYVIKKFSHISNSIFINHNKNHDSRQDMYLMSKCRHNITANSTFSWRWAYLNNIITPSQRFVKWHKYEKNNIIPNSWISL